MAPVPHNIVGNLAERGLITPPSWLPGNTQYLGIMGSEAYGVSEGSSDLDIYGFAIPPKATVFPHLAGYIPGFGAPPDKFETYQQHHIKDPDGKDRSYDIEVFSVVKFADLCLKNNPNVIDALFLPESCIIHCSKAAQIFRDNRRKFLHRGAWPRFKGYAHSQLHKINGKGVVQDAMRAREIEAKFGIPHDMDFTTFDQYDIADIYEHAVAIPDWFRAMQKQQRASYRELLRGNEQSSRFADTKLKGIATKALYHVVRLVSEVEQILTEGDLDLREKGRREHMKAVRRGEVPVEDVVKWFGQKQIDLERAYANTKLPMKPPQKEAQALLMQVLEHHYGSLSEAVQMPDRFQQALREVDRLIAPHRKYL